MRRRHREYVIQNDDIHFFGSVFGSDTASCFVSEALAQELSVYAGGSFLF